MPPGTVSNILRECDDPGARFKRAIAKASSVGVDILDFRANSNESLPSAQAPATFLNYQAPLSYLSTITAPSESPAPFPQTVPQGSFFTLVDRLMRQAFLARVMLPLVKKLTISPYPVNLEVEEAKGGVMPAQDSLSGPIKPGTKRIPSGDELVDQIGSSVTEQTPNSPTHNGVGLGLDRRSNVALQGSSESDRKTSSAKPESAPGPTHVISKPENHQNDSDSSNKVDNIGSRNNTGPGSLETSALEDQVLEIPHAKEEPKIDPKERVQTEEADIAVPGSTNLYPQAADKPNESTPETRVAELAPVLKAKEERPNEHIRSQEIITDEKRQAEKLDDESPGRTLHATMESPKLKSPENQMLVESSRSLASPTGSSQDEREESDPIWIPIVGAGIILALVVLHDFSNANAGARQLKPPTTLPTYLPYDSVSLF